MYSDAPGDLQYPENPLEPIEICMPCCVCTKGYVLTDEDLPQCIKTTRCPRPTIKHCCLTTDRATCIVHGFSSSSA
ncbi:hypothetical protein GDO78_019310, partial [Eleutherodactylus coqui]